MAEPRQGREAYALAYTGTSRITGSSSLVPGSLAAIARTLSRFSPNDDGGKIVGWGIGATNFVDIRPGVPKGALTLEVSGVPSGTNSTNVLAWAVRTSDVLPWVHLACGITPAAEYSRYIHNGKVNSQTVKFTQGELVTITTELIHGMVTQGTATAAHSNVTGAALQWDEAIWTGTSSPLPININSLEYTIKHNLTEERMLGGTALIAARQYSRDMDYLKEGREEIEGTIVSPLPPGAFIAQANSWTEIDASIELTPRGGGTGFTVTFTDMVVHSDSCVMSEGEAQVEYTYPFQCKSITTATSS